MIPFEFSLPSTAPGSRRVLKKCAMSERGKDATEGLGLAGRWLAPGYVCKHAGLVLRAHAVSVLAAGKGHGKGWRKSLCCALFPSTVGYLLED